MSSCVMVVMRPARVIPKRVMFDAGELLLTEEKESLMATANSLETTYCGIKLRNPLLVGACGKTETTQGVVDLAKAGVGGVVMKTLFQCQVQRLRPQPPYELRSCGKSGYISHIFHSYEPGTHTLESYKCELKKAARAVDIPVIASISCSDTIRWKQYAKECMEAGAAMIELNVSCPVLHGGIPTLSDPNHRSAVGGARSHAQQPLLSLDWEPSNRAHSQRRSQDRDIDDRSPRGCGRSLRVIPSDSEAGVPNVSRSDRRCTLRQRHRR